MFKQSIKLVISDIVRSQYQKIEVHPGLCRYNYHCHSNSVHDAINSDDNEIALCIYFDGIDPTIHFINFSGDIYTDNTLGHWSSQMEYYLIRHISKNEFYDVYKIHTSFRKHIRNLLPWYLRIFHSFDDL